MQQNANNVYGIIFVQIFVRTRRSYPVQVLMEYSNKIPILLLCREIPMYGSEKYRVITSCADSALLTVLANTILLYTLTTICVFFAGCDEFSAGGDYFSRFAMFKYDRLSFK